jgi:hypothetical protein
LVIAARTSLPSASLGTCSSTYAASSDTLLSARRARPWHHRSAEKCDELAPSQVEHGVVPPVNTSASRSRSKR